MRMPAKHDACNPDALFWPCDVASRELRTSDIHMGAFPS